jgi:hypothetical protein
LTVVDAWAPEWASVSIWGCLTRLRHDATRTVPPIRAGWLTYLPAPLAAKIMPPKAAMTERAPDGGLLMLATKEPPSLDNPAHLAAIDAIQAALAPLQELTPKGWQMKR